MRYFLDLFSKSSSRDVEHDLALDASRRRFLVLSAALPCTAALGLSSEPGLAAPRDRASASLEIKVDAYIKELRRLGRISSDESTAWSVYDFTSDKKLVAINEDMPYQSASMIKPFVALAFFFRVAENRRRYSYDRRTQSIMESMIRRSNNRATNYFIDLIGNKPRDVERVLKSNAPSVFQQTSIVERIPPSGRTYQNKASAHDYSRFLYGVWNDRFPFSYEIKKFMSLPNKDRICYGANQIPSITRVYDKTGTTARLCGNMGILEARGRDGRSYPYTFVGIIQKARRAGHYGLWVHTRGDVIREVSNRVYLGMKGAYNLV